MRIGSPATMPPSWAQDETKSTATAARHSRRLMRIAAPAAW